MANLLTRKYYSFLATRFKSVFDASNNAYLFVGRPQAWANTANGSVNDSNPEVPTQIVQNTDFEYWRDMLGIKKIAVANTNLVTTRNDWANNTIYAQYDDLDEDLHTKTFFVLDTTGSPYRVYKCLWNNNGGESNVAPRTIGTASAPTATADGYVWKYMYSMSAEYDKFLTTSQMPIIVDAVVQNNAITFAGQLPIAVPLIVANGGSSYNSSLTTTVTIEGDGLSASIVSGGVNIANNQVTAVVLASSGTGYTQVNSINVFQTLATSANVRIIIPPYPNHGYDAAKELFAKGLSVIGKLDTSESGALTVVNNFRRVGLIINPLLASGAPAEDTFYKQTYDITMSANTGVLAPDDVIFNTTKEFNPTAIVVDVVSGVLRLTAINAHGESEPFGVGDVLRCEVSGIEATVGSIDLPELKYFSGDILYVDNRTAITRANTQTEEFKFVFNLG